MATDHASLDVISQLFEGLVSFDDQGQPAGLGAESWDISGDGLTYTFKLRDGPVWSDGKPVTAADYEWAWKRNLDPRTASDYATAFYPIKNAVRIHREGVDPSQLGVRAVDDRTLEVTLEQPAAFFLRLASTWVMVPLRQDVLQRFGDRWTEAGPNGVNIVTNGPFVLREWRHDAQLVLDRNDRYWGAKPAIQRVVYRVFPDDGAEHVAVAYEAGELDTFGSGAAFEPPSSFVDRLLADPRAKAEVKVFSQSATMFIAVNHRRPHLRDTRVRIALGEAIERQRVLDQVLKRVGSPSRSLQPEGILGRDPSLWPTEDLDGARARLAEAGFPGGRGMPELTFTYNINPQWKALGEYLQQRYREALGISLKLEPMDWPTFLRWRGSDDWQANGDLYRGGWFSDYEDPNNWHNVLWDSAEDAAVFSSGWKNDEYDRVIREARAELDPARRAELYHRAEEILAREYPHIPVFHASLRTLVKPYVENYRPDRVLGLTSLKRVRITER